MANSLKVVSALILNQNHEMLMTLRNVTSRRPNCWENPRGKVEPGETDQAALKRELSEELGVDSSIGSLVSVARIDVEATLLMMLYEVTIIGEPMPLASQAIKWMVPSQVIVWSTCAPGTYLYYRDIENHIASRVAREIGDLLG